MASKKTTVLILAAAAAAGMIWIARRRQDVPGLSVWKSVLIEKHGEDEAQRMADRVRETYVQLLSERPLPENHLLRGHVTGHILPGLALYRALLQEYVGDKQAALAEVDQAFRLLSLAQNRVVLAPLKFFPLPPWLFKLATGLSMKGFPAEGWDFEMVENSNTRVAFNATRCFYLNTLTAYKAPELTASFCKTDDVMAELFPPTVKFVRDHTLGRGDALCDFQYCLVEKA